MTISYPKDWVSPEANPFGVRAPDWPHLMDYLKGEGYEPSIIEGLLGPRSNEFPRTFVEFGWEGVLIFTIRSPKEDFDSWARFWPQSEDAAIAHLKSL